MVVGHRPADVVLRVALEEREEVRLPQERLIGVSAGEVEDFVEGEDVGMRLEDRAQWGRAAALPTQEDYEVAVVGRGDGRPRRLVARGAMATTGSGAGAGGSAVGASGGALTAARPARSRAKRRRRRRISLRMA